MPGPAFRPEEARRELARLRSLPQTPTRQREIAGLERALLVFSSAAQISGNVTRTSVRKARQQTEYLHDKHDDDKPEPAAKPTREVRYVDGHRRVTVRSATRKREPSDADNEARNKRERTRRLEDLKGMLGGYHRGMD
jgi:hypothetical protein